ncbi:hypothetical protein ACCO45_001773 [Purpureocillium lilacinum]|uniref:Uncharacterized protein n=1 Tax=Purpureocillium lilacinum TaxID=33203 RepID=A0ACC4EAK9_PURLI
MTLCRRVFWPYTTVFEERCFARCKKSQNTASPDGESVSSPSHARAVPPSWQGHGASAKAPRLGHAHWRRRLAVLAQDELRARVAVLARVVRDRRPCPETVDRLALAPPEQVEPERVLHDTLRVRRKRPVDARVATRCVLCAVTIRVSLDKAAATFGLALAHPAGRARRQRFTGATGGDDGARDVHDAPAGGGGGDCGGGDGRGRRRGGSIAAAAAAAVAKLARRRLVRKALAKANTLTVAGALDRLARALAVDARWVLVRRPVAGCAQREPARLKPRVGLVLHARRDGGQRRG